MCGPMAAAAAATADASGAFAVTTKMLPPGAHARVSFRTRSFAVEEIGVLEELDVPRRLPHPRQQNGGVAELLLRVRVDVEHVVPKRKSFGGSGREIVDLREPIVVEGRKPCLHLILVATPVVDKRLRRGVIAERKLFLPDVLGLSLQTRPPALLDIERVHQRPAQIARGHAGWRQEFGPRELRRALEHAVLHPVAEAEERLEILPAHGVERNAVAMRRGTFQSAGVLAGANVNAGSCGERRASAAIAMRSRSSSSCTSSPRFIARM